MSAEIQGPGKPTGGSPEENLYDTPPVIEKPRTPEENLYDTPPPVSEDLRSSEEQLYDTPSPATEGSHEDNLSTPPEEGDTRYSKVLSKLYKLPGYWDASDDVRAQMEEDAKKEWDIDHSDQKDDESKDASSETSSATPPEEGAKKPKTLEGILEDIDSDESISAKEKSLYKKAAIEKWNREDQKGKSSDEPKMPDGETPNSPETPETDERVAAYFETHPELTDEQKEFFRKLSAEDLLDKDKLPLSQTETATAEREKHLKQELERIEKEVNSEFADKYASALEKYAQLKADHDTKGRFGRTKRESGLKEAEEALRKVKLAYAKSLVGKKQEAGFYEGDADTQKQQKTDEMFDEVRKIDTETREATNKVLLDRKEQRNVFTKGIVQFGKFLNWGKNKFARGAKNVGTGLALGFTVGLTGAGLPITAAAGLAASLVARYGATVNNLDKTLQSHIDEEGKAKPLIDDEKFKNLVESVQKPNEGWSLDAMSDKVARDILSHSREVGEKENRDARRKAGARVGEVAAGFAIGGFAGHFAHNAWFESSHNAVAANSNSSVANGSNGSTGSASGNVGAGASSGNTIGGGNTLSGGEFSSAAHTVSPGEGWYQTFQDMGIDQSKWSTLLNRVGPQLEQQGWAYTMPDGSWGISHVGQLPDNVLNIIQSSTR